MRNTSLIITALLLTSCSFASRMSENDAMTKYYVIRSEFQGTNYTIHEQETYGSQHQDWMTYVDDIDHFHISYPADYPEKKPVFMSEMSIERPESSCSSDHIGALEVKEIQAMGDTTLWAKMPLLSAYDRFQNTFCHPAPPDCTDTELFTGTCETDYAMYAFCSEQGEKIVAICLSQITDDPEMAEEIFKTFRWVK